MKTEKVGEGKRLRKVRGWNEILSSVSDQQDSPEKSGQILCGNTKEGYFCNLESGHTDIFHEHKESGLGDVRWSIGEGVEMPALDVTIDEKQQVIDTVRSDEGRFWAPRLLCRERQLLAALTEKEELKRQFNNFHRSLCERFGYVHDDKDWMRDQVSLEEYVWGELKHVQDDLKAMTEDRNLWQGEHNEDCPNLSQVEELKREVAKLDSAFRQRSTVRIEWIKKNEAEFLKMDELRKENKRLNDVCKEFVWGEGESATETINRLESELSSLRTSVVSGEWIDCRDRLPAYGVKVMVSCQGVVQHVSYSRDIGEWVPCVDDYDNAPNGTFSHWMPLPAPPKPIEREG